MTRFYQNLLSVSLFLLDRVHLASPPNVNTESPTLSSLDACDLSGSTTLVVNCRDNVLYVVDTNYRQVFLRGAGFEYGYFYSDPNGDSRGEILGSIKSMRKCFMT